MGAMPSLTAANTAPAAPAAVPPIAAPTAPSAPWVMQDVIKDIGRGAAGARSLPRERAAQTMHRVLAGQLSDLQLGALLIALRMKGENLDEICGFLSAVQAHCMPLPSEQPVVLLPSYNGARRLCNLTPLLALALAQAGLRVLVHGPLPDVANPRVTTAAVFHDLGLSVLTDAATAAADAHRAWSRHEPAFIHTAVLCPPLHTLLGRRAELGVRNVGHTLAKMLNPVCGAPSLRLVNHTHPEFGALMAQWAVLESASAMLLRGTEGEPVADPRRMPRIDTYVQGRLHAPACCPAQDGVLAAMPSLPSLPTSNDAATTAVYVQAVIAGERPAPAPLARQVQLVLAAVAALHNPPVPAAAPSAVA
jgi:anthranilate phosphoribosyltransferase